MDARAGGVKEMKVSLIVTTYNWKEALEVVLQSVITQKVFPNEVIIADDGSRDDTKELIDSYAKIFPVPLIHSWQEDDGFRAAKSRNKAIAKASYEYIVMIDGDIMLHPNFIKDHIKASREGFFVQGCRALLNEELCKDVINGDTRLSIFTKGIKNRKNVISNSVLSSMFSRVWNSDKSTRTCNFAAWKQDLINVNGFNEKFEGWGREDSELVIRMLNHGLNRIYLKFAGVGFHLYHPENERKSLEYNDFLLKNTIDEKLSQCELGLNQQID